MYRLKRFEKIRANGPSLNIHIDYVDSQIPSCEDDLCRDPDYLLKIDMAAKRRKKHKNKISGLVISKCYETEIREF